jgi:hypothetical protein
MTKSKDKRGRGIQRYFIGSHRSSSLHIIPFDNMVQAEHVVRISDISVVGVGIESTEPIEHGLVCFEDAVGGHKIGVLTWCRPFGEGFRAGINFVTLPHEHERYILKQVKQTSSHKVLRDPEKIIETLLNSIKRETNG